VMVPRALAARAQHVDVAASMDDRPLSRAVSLKMASAHPESAPTLVESDPFAEVET